MHGDKSIDSEQSHVKKILNAIIEGVVSFKTQNKTYQAGATSMRDVMIAAIKLKKNGKLTTMDDIKNYIFHTLKSINTVYATNKKFSAYYKADTQSQDENINKDWFQPYFSFFGRGQDSHTAKRVKFLMDKMNEFVDVTQRDKTRIFPLDMQLRVLETQNNKCKICDGELIFSEVQADHILEHSLGGQTTEDNLQLLCVSCHKEKTKEFMKEKNLAEV